MYDGSYKKRERFLPLPLEMEVKNKKTINLLLLYAGHYQLLHILVCNE